MFDGEISVNHHFMMDLQYRIAHASLTHSIYSIEFIEWVKAGIAYNTKGQQDSTRCIAYFCDLLSQLESQDFENYSASFKVAVLRFYEDLYNMYAEHLNTYFRVSTGNARSSSSQAFNLLLIPRFSATPQIYSVLEKHDVKVGMYAPNDNIEFENRIRSVSVDADTMLYHGMSLMFDYGVKRAGDGIILEVC